MCEYDLTTEISIRLLIQPRTCKIGSSIFAAMSRLKFASTTRASLHLAYQQQKEKTDKMLPLLVELLIVHLTNVTSVIGGTSGFSL